MDTLSDHELTARARNSEKAAMAELWRRHARAGMDVARKYVDAHDADDLVAEAFTQTFSALQRGVGPSESFGPYLRTVVRNLAFSDGRRRSRLSDNEIDFDQLPGADISPRSLESRFDHEALGRAFRTLPESWQRILWCLEVDRMRPREVAKLVEMRAGAVSSLAYRARAALRAAWVQEHVESAGTDPECRLVLLDYGDYQTRRLGSRAIKRFEDHVRSCESCPDVIERAKQSSGRIAVIIGGLVLGAGVAEASLDDAKPASASTAKAPRAGFRAIGLRDRRVACFVRAGSNAAVTVVALIGTILLSTADKPVLDNAARSTRTSQSVPTPTPTPTRPEDGENAQSAQDSESLPHAPQLPTLDAEGAPKRLQKKDLADHNVSADRPAEAVAVPLLDASAPTAPTIESSWSAWATSAPALRGSAEPGSTVTVVAVGSGARATTVATPVGAWSVTVVDMAPTDTVFEVTATDSAGNVSATVESNRLAFAPLITSPIVGSAQDSNTLFLSAWGWPNAAAVLELNGKALGRVTFDASGETAGYFTTGDSLHGLQAGQYTITLTYQRPDGSTVAANGTRVDFSVRDAT